MANKRKSSENGGLRGYRQMFDITCLVDPGICMELTKSRGVNRSEHCYAVWNKTHRCERCISQELVRYGGAYVKGRISQTINKADLAMYEAKT